MRTYYIYKATNIINGKSYIGKTNDIKSRIWQHLRRYEREDCLFHREMEKYGDDNFSWDVLETTDTEEKAVELEKKYIQEYNTIKPFGYNMNKGGVGGHNSRPVVCLEFDGTYVKRYDSAGDAKKDGFNDSDVLLCCKNKQSRCKDKMFMFEDEYLENGAKTYQKPQFGKTKSIVQCDEQGNMIAEYDSVNQASKSTGILRTRISSAISGLSKHAGGYIFVYKEEFPIKDISVYSVKKKGRKVAQVDIKTNEIIKVFDRIADAGRELNVNYKAIHKVVDKEDRTAYGYKWISQ